MLRHALSGVPAIIRSGLLACTVLSLSGVQFDLHLFQLASAKVFADGLSLPGLGRVHISIGWPARPRVNIDQGESPVVREAAGDWCNG